MAAKTTFRTVSALTLGLAVLLSTAPAAALPSCVNTAPNTTQCETNGSTQITTRPGDWTYGWPGYGWSGLGWPGFVFSIG